MTDKFQNAFISYGRVDSKAFVLKLYQRLINLGFKIWLDQSDIPLAVDFQDQINNGIEKSDNFLFIISPHSVNSLYCLREVEYAIQRNKRIIPIMHVEQVNQAVWQQRNPDGNELDWKLYQDKGLHSCYPNMHPEIARINWVNFREEDDYEVALGELLKIFDRHQDYVRQHTVLLIQALEWQRHQKQAQYLLIGEERQQAETWLKKRFKNETSPCFPTNLHCEFITESTKNANNLMTQVFLAHADEDDEIAEQICCSLMREGITVWTNKTDIQTGTAFQEAIKRGIEEADNIVYLLSPSSLQSQYCRFELDYARSLNKRIIPLLVKETDLREIPDLLRDLQYIDLTDNREAADYARDESQLLRVLRHDAIYYEEHKLLLVKALKWQQQKRNPSILLRGYNLRHAETWLKLAKQTRHHPATTLQETFITESLRQPPDISLDVFVSYSRADSDFARRLNDALQIQSKRTWFDQESIASGADFQNEIYRGIETSDHFLFIISPSSINSPYCNDEVEYAQKLNKRIVTVLHRPIDHTALHPGLANVQWIDFNQRGGDFAANFNDLIRTLDTDLEHLNAHTRLLVRAIEWDNRGRNDSLLLRGDDLEEAEQWLTQGVTKEPRPTELHADYISTGRRVEKTQQDAAIARERRARKRITFALVGAIAGFVVASLSGFIAFGQFKSAEARRVEADEQRQLAVKNADEAKQNADEAGKQRRKAIGQAQLAQRNEKRAKEQATLAERRREEAEAASQRAIAAKQAETEQRQVAEYQRNQAIANRNQAVQNQITAYTSLSEARLLTHDSLEALLTSVKASKELVQLQKTASVKNDIRIQTTAGLQQALSLGHELNRLEQNSDVVRSASFSPDGRLVASGSWDKTIKLWKSDGTLLWSKSIPNQLVAVSFSPDGKAVASADNAGNIQLWNLDGNLIQQFSNRVGITDLQFSPDGQTIAATSGSREASGDGSIRIWSINGKLLKTLDGHSTGVNSIRFSPNGQLLASAGQDKTVKLWKVTASTPLKTLTGHQDEVTSVSFSSDGQVIASGDRQGAIKLWRVDGTSMSTSFDRHPEGIASIQFISNRQMLATAGYDGTIKLWRLTDGRLLDTLSGHQGNVRSIDYDPRRHILLSSSDDRTIRLWQIDKYPTWHEGSVQSISVSPNGQWFASAGFDGMIKIWNAANSHLVRTLDGNDRRPVTTIQFSLDGKLLASPGSDKTIKLRSIPSGDVVRTLKIQSQGTSSISLSPNGKLLAAANDASKDTNIQLWDLATGQSRLLKGHTNGITSIRFSPDGKLLASGSWDKTVRLWRIADGKLLQTLKGHEQGVNSVRFSPDGKTLASASSDKTIRLWQVTEGTPLLTLTGHGSGVTDVAFSPDGKVLASSSADRSIKLWDVQDGSLIHTLTGHQQVVNSISFMPDGQALISGSQDKTVRIWNLNLVSLLKQSCDRLHDYLKTNPYVEKSDRSVCSSISKLNQ